MNECDIFIAARHITAADKRQAFLHEACSGDEALRGRVDELLQAHERAGSFLHTPAAGVYTPTAVEPPVTEAPGTVIGPYRLLEEIGEGGFGIVYMAEQSTPVRRRVALKILKPGMDTRQVIARFEAERQALALMDHPNIAKVFDGSATTFGRPYFVMELVRGVPITDFCDANHLTPRERLELFVPVCLAVQHAHQKGIIHRDLKPSNVLVTVHDTRPVAKVIDFGVAKALGQELTEKTLFTGFAQLVGTPLYMSPEQAGQSGLDIDTRSDVYSLGVLLYELLTGTTPFNKERLKQAAYDEIRRIIREEEPPRPSVRISTLRNAETAARAQGAANRKPLFPAVLGELDWIVMKALEKDRNRRYESAGALARDVERYLADEPVQACPPSNWYRFRKFARRNKTVLATASVVGLAVLLALATLTASTLMITREQRLTENALERETRAKDDLAHTLTHERGEAYFQRIAAAHRELSADNLGRALELLEACPKELREWEWRYLMRLCRVPPLVLSDNTEINGLAFSPDGQRLASAGGDGTIKIWNSQTGDLVQTLENAHSDSVVAVAFHRDGEHLASAGTDRRVRVWDLLTKEELSNEPCDVVRKLGTAYTVAFSADGRQLAAVSDGAVTVWDWQKRRRVHAYSGHDSHSNPVAFSRDGRLATGTREGLKLWRGEAGGLPLLISPAHRHPVSALAFSPDGARLASASFDQSVKLWDTTTGGLLRAFPHPGPVDCVAFSPDPAGKRLASGGEDKTVHIWDAAGREVLALRGHTGRCGCVAFSPDGLRLASASTDKTIRFWDATPLKGDERQEVLSFTEHNEGVLSVAFSPDGEKIASAGYDAVVKVWKAETGQVSAEFGGHALVVFCVAWQPDGERIASAGSDGQRHAVRVWDVRNGRDAFAISAESERAAVLYSAVAFSPDGRHLVTGKIDGAVQIWDALTGERRRVLGISKREIRGLVFSRDGRHLASSSEGAVMLWDATRLDENQEARTLLARVPGPGLNVAFSPDGRRLATGGEANTVILWDVQTGEKLQTLWGQHSGEVYAVAFSPDRDGRWVATAGEDSAVKIWDSHSGKLIRSFRGHEGLVSCLAFSPNGSRLVSGSRDTTVKVWDVTRLSGSERKP